MFVNNYLAYVNVLLISYILPAIRKIAGFCILKFRLKITRHFDPYAHLYQLPVPQIGHSEITSHRHRNQVFKEFILKVYNADSGLSESRDSFKH